MINDNDNSEGEEWKFSDNTENPKNKMDYENKVIVNTYSNIPFSQDTWKIGESEKMRVDCLHKNTYFSIVLGDRPFIEIYSTDQYGNLKNPPERIFDLGPYFTR